MDKPNVSEKVIAKTKPHGKSFVVDGQQIEEASLVKIINHILLIASLLLTSNPIIKYFQKNIFYNKKVDFFYNVDQFFIYESINKKLNLERN